MLRVGFVFAFALALQHPASAQDLDQMERPPADWAGPVFSPSFKFPQTFPADEKRPWEAIDFQTDPRSYLAEVLRYVLEGQDRQLWRVQDNKVRKWYHAPWLGPSGYGREFIHGLTRERVSVPFELGQKQEKCRQNWAFGIYNPIGGYALGKIWAPVIAGTGGPDFSALPFPNGTVISKILFTEADTDELELLAGTLTWQANIAINADPASPECPPVSVGDPPMPAPRGVRPMRLLQVDVAVRDPNADRTTGWVFGTFVYNGRSPGSDPWRKLEPVGLTWGTDPQLSDELAAKGERPTESIVLSDLGFSRAFGRSGRMNGPVDNPTSTCLSCHMTAQWPSAASFAPPANSDWDVARCWFRNLGPSEPFGMPPAPGIKCGDAPAEGVSRSLDFSLLLRVGLKNWTAAHEPAHN